MTQGKQVQYVEETIRLLDDVRAATLRGQLAKALASEGDAHPLYYEPEAIAQRVDVAYRTAKSLREIYGLEA